MVLGFILVVLSFADISGLSKISTRDKIIYPIFWTGIGLMGLSIVTSIAMHVTSRGSGRLSFLSPSSIEETDNGFRVPIGRAVMNVVYGRIEDYGTGEDAAVVALPANEFFDDECIYDRHSSLGAYMQSKFPNRIDHVQRLVKEKLQSIPSKEVEKTPGVLEKSYGVGRVVLLDNLNGSLALSQQVALAAVTEQRAGQGRHEYRS